MRNSDDHRYDYDNEDVLEHPDSNPSRFKEKKLITSILNGTIKCWYFGCTYPPRDQEHLFYDYYGYLHCYKCEETINDFVVPRHYRLKEWSNYWLYRKWWPEKCSGCGKRFKCDGTEDCLPF